MLQHNSIGSRAFVMLKHNLQTLAVHRFTILIRLCHESPSSTTVRPPVPRCPALSSRLTPQTKQATALKKAVTFFREKVSAEGGYLWRYSEDLSLREGEEKATATQAWLQPPGTPAVGEAFLAAYERDEGEVSARRGGPNRPRPGQGPTPQRRLG